MEQVPPLDLCIGSRRIEFIKPNTNVNAIIYCPNTGLSSLRVNSLLYTAVALNIGGLQATPIGASGYSAVVIPNSAIPAAPALIRITSDAKFHVATNGFTGGTGNYVYYSDYAKNTELIDPITGQPTATINVGTVQVGVPKETCLTFSSCSGGAAIVSATSSGGGLVTFTSSCFTYTMLNTTNCFTETVTVQLADGNGVISTA